MLHVMFYFVTLSILYYIIFYTLPYDTLLCDIVLYYVQIYLYTRMDAFSSAQAANPSIWHAGPQGIEAQECNSACSQDAQAFGWLSKLWSPFGSPKYLVPYYTKDPKVTKILTTSHLPAVVNGFQMSETLQAYIELCHVASRMGYEP